MDMYQAIDFITNKNIVRSNEKFSREKTTNLKKIFENCNDKIQEKTTLQTFYSNQCIFITGGTGFLGKILIEKLLRCCPEISRIYLLVRPKKDKTITSRINELLNNSIFDWLRENLPEFSNKIIGIPGDCSYPDLGISIEDRKRIIDEVSIIFHAAATVRFNEEIIIATNINIQSTYSINEMCQNMPKLKSIVHVSTAYANCFSSCIEEKFYDYEIKSEDWLNLIQSIPKDIMHKISPQLMSSWPNTYTFTKALAEDLIRTKFKNLPIGIFRPGIVLSSAKEPLPGWIDNYYGPTGIVSSMAIGLMRVFFCDRDKIANIVPVDLTVNALIASAWDIATHVDRRNEEMLIYNFTSTIDAPLSWGTFHTNVRKYVDKYPTQNAFWISIIRFNKHKLTYWFNIFFLHWIPAVLTDFILVIIGQKSRFTKIYQKLHYYSYIITYFCTNEWKFPNNNVESLWQQLSSQDKQLFPFSMHNFDWQTYLENYIKGIRVYLLKDDLKSLEASKRKWRRLFWMHQLLILLLFVFGCWFMWNIMSRIFY